MVDPRGRYHDDIRLKPGVSLARARAALTTFCLKNFGGDGQYFADVIDLCVDAIRLQEALGVIRAEVGSRCPERLPELAASVREINEGAGTSRGA